MPMPSHQDTGQEAYEKIQETFGDDDGGCNIICMMVYSSLSLWKKRSKVALHKVFFSSQTLLLLVNIHEIVLWMHILWAHIKKNGREILIHMSTWKAERV